MLRNRPDIFFLFEEKVHVLVLVAAESTYICTAGTHEYLYKYLSTRTNNMSSVVIPQNESLRRQSLILRVDLIYISIGFFWQRSIILSYKYKYR